MKIFVILATLAMAEISGLAETLAEKIRAKVNLEEIRRTPAAVSGTVEKCSLAGADYGCTYDYGRHFLKPYPPALPRNFAAFHPPWEWAIFGWAPLVDVHNGFDILSKIRSAAVSGIPLDCIRDWCYVAIHAQPASATADRREVFAVCEALLLDRNLGPPESCSPFAVSDGSHWWMRIVQGTETRNLMVMAAFDVDINGLSREAILAAVDRSLSEAPLSIPVRMVRPAGIMATGVRRFSPVLPGNWFEWVQVLVELDSTLKLEVSLDLLVNKQNTADPAHWHLPTTQQQEQYSQAIRSALTRSLEQVCSAPKWTGSNHLTCSAFKVPNGGTVSSRDVETFHESNTRGANSRPDNRMRLTESRRLTTKVYLPQ